MSSDNRQLEHASLMSKLPPLKAPSEVLTTTLRKHQEEGLRWMAWRERPANTFRGVLGGILGDEAGLGKTAQILALVACDIMTVEPTLVIVPAHLIYTWHSEAMKHASLGSRPLRVLLYYQENIGYEFDDADYDIVVTPFTTLTGEYTRATEQFSPTSLLARHRFARIVVDEAQQGRNDGTKVASMLTHLPWHHGQCRWIVSATPVYNSLEDLHPLLCFLRMEPYANAGVKTIWNRLMYGLQSHPLQAMAEIHGMIDPIMIRRQARYALADEVPEAEHSVVQLVQGERERAFYVSLFAGACARVNDILNQYDQIRIRRRHGNALATDKKEMSRAHADVLALITRLRRACVSPYLVLLSQQRQREKREALNHQVEIDHQVSHPDVRTRLGSPIESSAKLAWLREFLSGVGVRADEKVIIVSQWKDCLDLVQDHVIPADRRSSMVRLNGTTPIRIREEIKNRFQTDPNCRIALASLKACNQGMTLTAANVMVSLDQWWNEATEYQMDKRIHRIGQTKVARFYRLILNDTIEVAMKEMKRMKSNLSDALVHQGKGDSGAEDWSKRMRSLFNPSDTTTTTVSNMVIDLSSSDDSKDL